MRDDFWHRLRLPWRTSQEIAGEVDEEIGLHLEMRTEELIAEGMAPDDARAQATEEFGDATTTRRLYVSRRRRSLLLGRVRLWLDDLVQDLRFAARSLGHDRAFATMAIVVMALGIGAPATVLTLVNKVLLDRPTHVLDPHRLVRVFPTRGQDRISSFSNADYVYYRSNASTLSGLAAWSDPTDAAYRIGDDEPDQLRLMYVSDNYFDVLDTRPVLGRTFLPEENATPGTDPVVVLSHGFWMRTLGGAPDVVGTTISFNDVTFSVIGVAPDRFTGISPAQAAPDAWVPIAMYGALQRAADDAWWQREPDLVQTWLDAVGRLADGVTVEAVQSNFVAMTQSMEYEGKDADLGTLVTRQYLYRPQTQRDVASLSAMLLVVVAMVLVIAAANVAVLLLARATTRARELGIRAAMGARRGRLVRQLVTESLLLGLFGGAGGVAIAYVSSGVAARLIPLPLEPPFTPDGWVLAASAALALGTSFLVGLLPALHGVRADVRSILHHEPSPVGGARLRGALVVSQVGLSMVLVAGAFLFARSFRAAQQQSLGFATDNLLIIGTDLQSLGYDADLGRPFVTRARQVIAALPGVNRVTTSRMIPFRGQWITDTDEPEGEPGNRALVVGLNTVSPDYFEITGIDILEGRAIGPDDVAEAQRVAVINRTLAERLWPDEEALGRVLPFAGEPLVVGIARDATYYELGERPQTQAYFSVQQRYVPLMYFVVHARGDAAALAPAVESALRSIEPSLAFNRVTTMAAVVEEQLARYQISAVLVSLFGLIALMLAAVGLYGVVSYLTSRRTREIGVRMALGASRRRVARQVLGSGLRLALLGVVLGLVAAAALRGLTGSLLFGVAPEDPLSLGAACVALVAVTSFAAAAPALRAAHVDPMEAIRSD